MDRQAAAALLRTASANIQQVEAWIREAEPGPISPTPLDPKPTPSPIPSPTPAPTTTPPQRGLLAPAEFYDVLRDSKYLGPKISRDEFEGCEALLAACGVRSLPLSHTAYVLATAWHETAGTMQPIPERGGDAYLHRMYDINGARPDKAKELGNTAPGDGVRYAGRGYAQVTGKANYQKLAAALDVPLVAEPARMLDPVVAGQAIVYGMATGLFTSRSLDTYLHRDREAKLDDFKAARQIVNGHDKDEHIANVALVFQQALVAGKWTV